MPVALESKIQSSDSQAAGTDAFQLLRQTNQNCPSFVSIQTFKLHYPVVDKVKHPVQIQQTEMTQTQPGPERSVRFRTEDRARRLVSSFC